MGAPARLALSGEMKGHSGNFPATLAEQCILLDHIPHSYAMPAATVNEAQYLKYAVTVWIPDVYCGRCFLQLITFMTDSLHGQTPGVTRAATQRPKRPFLNAAIAQLPDCGMAYHSCAPVSIHGSGAAKLRDSYTCDNACLTRNLDGLFQNSVSEASARFASTYFYRGDPGVWNAATFVGRVAGGTALTTSGPNACSSFLNCLKVRKVR